MLRAGPRAALRIGPRAALRARPWAALRAGPRAAIRAGLLVAIRAGPLAAQLSSEILTTWTGFCKTVQTCLYHVQTCLYLYRNVKPVHIMYVHVYTMYIQICNCTPSGRVLITNQVMKPTPVYPMQSFIDSLLRVQTQRATFFRQNFH